MAKATVKQWSDIEVGDTIFVTTPTRTFTYKVEAKNWRNRSMDVSYHKRPRILRQRTMLFNVHWLIAEGMVRRKA